VKLPNLKVKRGGGSKNAQKTHCPRGHPYTKDNTYRSNGTRWCKRCIAIRNKQRSRENQGRMESSVTSICPDCGGSIRTGTDGNGMLLVCCLCNRGAWRFAPVRVPTEFHRYAASEERLKALALNVESACQPIEDDGEPVVLNGTPWKTWRFEGAA
jgi:hypothetical protein